MKIVETSVESIWVRAEKDGFTYSVEFEVGQQERSLTICPDGHRDDYEDCEIRVHDVFSEEEREELLGAAEKVALRLFRDYSDGTSLAN